MEFTREERIQVFNRLIAKHYPLVNLPSGEIHDVKHYLMSNGETLRFEVYIYGEEIKASNFDMPMTMPIYLADKGFALYGQIWKEVVSENRNIKIDSIVNE